MNYLSSTQKWTIFIASEVFSLLLAIVISTDGASKDSSNIGIFFLLVFIGLSAAINAGAFGVSVLIKAAINSSQRDSIKTELLKDEYYRMEARRRLDKEGK